MSVSSSRRLAYRCAVRLLVPVAFLRLAVKGVRQRDYWRRWGERLGFVVRCHNSLWVHAVSVGEVRAAAPLITALEKRYPGRPLVLTTTTPTGSAQGRGLFGARVQHAYLPYDLPSAVRRFLVRTQPAALLILETEIWPTLFWECRAREIPVCLVNGRLSPRSFARYSWVRGLSGEALGAVTLIAAQSQSDAERLRQLGAPRARIQVTGNLKFDFALPDDTQSRGASLRADLGPTRRVWVAASTHEGEEEQVLEAHRALSAHDPGLALILVPRHPSRAAQVAKLCRRRGFTPVLRSQNESAGVLAEASVLLADTLGELPALIAAADVVFMGGSLVPVGGHNLLEPCALGKPVVFGPHMFNFAEIAEQVRSASAGRQIPGGAELGGAIGWYLNHREASRAAGLAGYRLIESNRGAVARTLALLEPVLGL